ncbi:MAG: hypothetical protein BGO01_20265 [Armatimonadetes bacterium 55-13]|nr:hypothetical protein [Armatimonadota bacterium]ODU51639.1 MAG: hypothetical protein ABT09_03570 [bacterium SCN 57-13]OJU64447.1 MAG: hypothetical protein BGO01_20265 [Armatimonadetes bacterium 55-13]
MLSFIVSQSSTSSLAARDAANSARAAETAVFSIEQRLDALELACAGLWDLLKTKHGYTDDDLAAAIHQVDARDGKVDGKITRVDMACPHCHRKLLTRNSNRCAWCGEAFTNMPF